MIYNISLINTDPTLDLSTERDNILEAAHLLESGGINGNKYSSVSKITILKITKRTIQADVIETDKTWHMHLGYEFNNNYNMGKFCYKDANNKNKEIMLEWH